MAESKCILVVEDDAISAKIAQFIFKNLGYNTLVVETGEAAVDLITKHHDDYYGIYMDIGLPAMKGIEVCIKVREYEKIHPTCIPLPIIAVTANFSAEDSKKYIAAGMQETFFKPLTPEKTSNFLTICDNWHKKHLKSS